MSKSISPTTNRMRVQFMDEAPRLGQGWRIVDVTIGRKWVRVKDCLGHKAKLTKAQWERVSVNASVLHPVKKRRKSGQLAKPERLELQTMLNKLFS